jgi:asparagine synthase (glutamine-hydrolysing)
VWSTLARVVNYLPESTSYYSPIKRTRRFVSGAALPPALAYLDFIRLFDGALSSKLCSDFGDYANQHFLKVCGREQVQLADLLRVNMATYLPDDLLIKNDRSSMATSLETRAPFLDHWLVEMVSTIPLNLKLKGSTTKYILKQIALDLLPPEIVNRPKHGFGVPLSAWLRKDASAVRETLLSREARQRGLFDIAAVETLINEHVSGRRDHGQRLWSLLSLEWWHRLFIDTPAPRRP